MGYDDDWDDEDDESDDSEFSAPLPPEDRLWRHPSEMRSAPIGAPDFPPSLPTPSAPAPAVAAPTPSFPKWRILVAAMAAGSVGALATVAGLGLAGVFERPIVVERVLEPAAPAPTTTQRLGLRSEALAADTDTAGIARKTAPAVPRLLAAKPTGQQEGSAVAFRSDGFFLTSAELVTGADKVELVSTGERAEARVVGIDTYSNIAILHIPGQRWRVPTFGSADDLVTGGDAVVLSAIDDGPSATSVSKGVFSALEQRVTLADGRSLSGMVQTDARMGPTALGSALLDEEGEVVGIISTMGDGPSGSVGLATPVDLALSVGDDIITHGDATRVWLGIIGSSVTDDVAQEFGIDGGVVVNLVVAGSPAEQAGIPPQAIITRVDGTDVRSMTDLVIALRRHEPNDFVRIETLIDGAEVSRLASLGQPPIDDATIGRGYR